MDRPSAAYVLFVLSGAGCAGTITLEDVVTPRPVPAGSCVVVGFLGGRDSWDDDDKGVRRLALELRQTPDIYVETFENRRRDVAENFVDAALSGAPERVRLVVYGQSFGGAAVVKFASQLAERDPPLAIDLTVQIDSVGRNDADIPANVRAALNLFQDDGHVIRGEAPIRAVDPARTTILGNLRFRYHEPPGSEISLDGVPFWKLIARVAHAKMDRDPRVWDTVERYIRSACAGERTVRYMNSAIR